MLMVRDVSELKGSSGRLLADVVVSEECCDTAVQIRLGEVRIKGRKRLLKSRAREGEFGGGYMAAT